MLFPVMANAQAMLNDTMSDFSKISDRSSNWKVESTNSSNFGGDADRFSRTNVSSAYLVYEFDEIADFSVDLWGVKTGGTGTVNVYGSGNGVNYSVISTNNAIVETINGYRTLTRYTPAEGLSGINYLKIELSGGDQSWKGHIGNINVSSEREPRNYYLSSSSGDDNNEGTLNSPWLTLEKISNTSLMAGDTVLFKRGDRFDGHFVVNGSGEETKPIVLTAYGEGNQPIITGEVGEQGGGDYQEAILVKNNDNIVFDGLEVNNERTVNRDGVNEEDAYGIYIVNSGNKVLNNFTLRNMTFKNVYAPKPVLKEEGEDSFNGLEVAGVTFYTSRNKTSGQEKNINNILVEDCYFTDLQRLGSHIKHAGGDNGVGNDSINCNTNIVFRNNEFHHLGGTSVLPIRTYNCLIEHNLFNHPGSNKDARMPARGSSVWTWRCHNTVIQYNKCLSTRGYLDSHGIHIDHENVNTFIQYNYMEDCEGGFVEILGGNVNSVYRFNVSVNDGWRENPGWKNSNHTLWINENVPSGTHYSDGNYIYNNTVYMDSAYTTAIDIDGKNTHIYNNIFHAKKGNIGGKQVTIKSNNTALYISNNLFQGTVDNRFKTRDNNAIVGNPDFHQEGALSKYGYQLKASSVAIDAGVAKLGPPIPNAGTGIFKHVPAYPDVDFYGNSVDLSQGTPNIGACNAKNGEIISSSIVPVKNVIFNADQFMLEIGQSFQLTASVVPADATDPTITWKVNDTSIATVDTNGKLTAVAEGTTEIVAMAEGGKITASAVVKVGDIALGFEDIKTDIRVHANGIDFLDSNPPFTVGIFDSTGRTLYSNILTNTDELSYAFTMGKVYIINVNDRIFKVKMANL